MEAEELDADERKGLLGRSPLLSLPDECLFCTLNGAMACTLIRFAGFDVTKYAVPDIMHLIDLGTVRVLATFTFKGSTARAHLTKYTRQDPDDVDLLMAQIKVIYTSWCQDGHRKAVVL